MVFKLWGSFEISGWSEGKKTLMTFENLVLHPRHFSQFFPALVSDERNIVILLHVRLTGPLRNRQNDFHHFGNSLDLEALPHYFREDI